MGIDRHFTLDRSSIDTIGGSLMPSFKTTPEIELKKKKPKSRTCKFKLMNQSKTKISKEK